MQQRDLATNVILVLLIGAVTYFLVTFEKSELTNPDWLVKSGRPDKVLTTETQFGAVAPKRQPRELAFVRYDAMRTIIPTPTPKPPTPRPTPEPPPIEQVMQLFDLVMPDPRTKSVMLTDKRTKEMTTWKVNEKRTINHPRGNLEVTLVKVDGSDFSCHFAAPPNQTYTMSIFK